MGIDLRVITPNYYYSILRDGRISVFRRLLWILFFPVSFSRRSE